MKKVYDEFWSASILYMSKHSSGTLVKRPSEINSNINVLHIFIVPCKEPASILHCANIYSPVSDIIKILSTTCIV
jgi:hypothetical protein